MVILLRLGLACDWATRRPADRVLARSSDLWRAFTLPEYSTRTKKEYGRLPPSANAFILAIGRYTAVYRPQARTVKKLVEYCNTAWNMDGVRHYPRWVRRVPGSTTSDQNRSCISALSVPETTISSHRPELTHNIFSPDPSIRLSKLSANTTKHTSAAIW